MWLFGFVGGNDDERVGGGEGEDGEGGGVFEDLDGVDVVGIEEVDVVIEEGV